MDMRETSIQGGAGEMFEAHPAPPFVLCCLETFGENANEQETEGLHDCMNSYTNKASTTTTQRNVVKKGLIMITTDKLMAALI